MLTLVLSLLMLLGSDKSQGSKVNCDTVLLSKRVFTHTDVVVIKHDVLIMFFSTVSKGFDFSWLLITMPCKTRWLFVFHKAGGSQMFIFLQGRPFADKKNVECNFLSNPHKIKNKLTNHQQWNSYHASCFLICLLCISVHCFHLPPNLGKIIIIILIIVICKLNYAAIGLAMYQQVDFRVKRDDRVFYVTWQLEEVVINF